MKNFKEIRNQVKEKYSAGNLNYAQDLDLAQKNMARLAKQEKGQEKKDYMAVARALNQGNLGAVKKIIKGISTDEVKADILNVLVGYNNLIAKMYPKAVDAKGKLKTPMSVSKMIKDDVNENYQLDEARMPMYKPTKFEGKKFDRKKEIKSLQNMQKAIHKVAKMQDAMQYTAETGGSTTRGNPHAIYQSLVDAEQAIFNYMGGIERGYYDGIIDMDRD